uniref:Nuclear factor NF-kappa-B p110 subunit n=1 Tax=Culex pipiens TaxID=7175 RepID=A0A8D8CWH8_CULPI
MSTLLNLDSYRHEQFEQHLQQPLSSSPTYSVLSMESSASSSSPSAVSTSHESAAKYYSSNSPSSSASSNMSPKSTTSETSSFNMQNLNISASFPYYDDGSSSQMQTYHFTTGHGNAAEHPQIELSVPHLVILEQPVDKFRFRYQSEMHGTHGSLMGVHTEKSKKTFPSVELRGFQGEAKIRCSLFQVDPSKRAAHSHHLVIKSGEIDLIDPHDIEVNAETGYVGMFQGMGIIHTAKKNIAEELCKKIKRQRAVEMNREISLREEHQLQKEAVEMAKTMNLNQVCLCFQAFQVDPVSGMWQQLCEPVYSNAINNMKSALTGELKICRLSSTAGNVEGGEEVFMFVEKVCKNNIKIRFYELDEYDQEIWQDWGTFSEADVHHQYAIAFKTPPYRNKDITEPAEVLMQLFRPRDKCQSEPVPFKYKPRPGMLASASSSRKRQRVHSGNISSEIPTTVPNDGGLATMTAATAGPSRLPALHQPFPMVTQSTISKEFNKSGIIQEILESNVQGHSGGPTGDITFNSGDFRDFIQCSSEDLHKLINEIGEAHEQSKLETDAVASGSGPAGGSHQEAVRLERALESYLEANRYDKDVEILRKILAIIKLFGRDYERCRELISALWMSSNKHKANCLHMAIERRESVISCKLVELLQEFQLHDLLGLVNDRNETALHLAVSSNQVAVIESLLLAGVRISCCDYKGNSALHCAVVDNCAEALDALVGHCKRNGLRTDTANDDGYSPLQLAVMCRNLRIAKLLLDRGASPTERDLKHGNNILHIAVESDSLDLVNYILEQVDKSLSDEPNNAGYTPLQLANARHQVNASNKLIVRELLRFNPGGRLEKEPSFEDGDEDDEEAATQDDLPAPPVEAGSSESVLLSMDLTCNRVEVIQLLENHVPTAAELTPLKTVPYGESAGAVSELFDEPCLTELCELLNQNNVWKELGSLLDFNAFFSIWEMSPNPAEMLLSYFEMQKMKLDHLIDILQALEQKDAIHCIDEMVCRNMK